MWEQLILCPNAIAEVMAALINLRVGLQLIPHAIATLPQQIIEIQIPQNHRSVGT
jgi:hypothetical protein